MSVSDRAYLIMQLHSIKYHNFDCIGVLIGRKVNNNLIIDDSIPLFHKRVMTGTCEIAFDMI